MWCRGGRLEMKERYRRPMRCLEARHGGSAQWRSWYWRYVGGVMVEEGARTDHGGCTGVRDRQWRSSAPVQGAA